MSGSTSSNPGAADGAKPEAAPLARGLELTVHPLPRVLVESSRDDHGGDGGGADGSDVADAARRRAGRLKVLLLLLVSAAPVIASYVMVLAVQPRGQASHGELLVPTKSWPADVALSDLEGRAADAATWRRQWTLVVFGSGRCDAACERRLHMQRQLREMLGRERERVDKVFVVVDDAPLAPALAVALAAQPTVRVLRAPGAAVAAWMGAPLDDVSARMFVVDPMGEWMMRTPRDVDPAKFKRDLDRLLRASASWDRAGRSP